MYRLAKTTFQGSNHAWAVRLLDDSLGAHADNALNLPSRPRRTVGTPSVEDPIPPILATRIDLDVHDVGGTLRSAMVGRPDADFRLRVRRGGTPYFRGVAGLSVEGEQLDPRADQVVRLVAYDGLTLLQEVTPALNGVRSIARWIYDMLSASPVTAPLHTYSTWAAASQTGTNLAGLYADGEALGRESEGRTAWDVLETLLRQFGLQLMQWEGEWIVVQRSARLNDTLTDAPVGASAETRDFRANLAASDVVLKQDGADVRGRRPGLPPAVRVGARWTFEQTPARNGAFDSERGMLFAWTNHGASVVKNADPVAIRHFGMGDYISQRFNAPPLAGSHLIVTATLFGSDSFTSVAQLLYHDVVSGATYSLDRDDSDGSGLWQAGDGSYLEDNSAYPHPDEPPVPSTQEYEIPTLPGSGAGYFELRTRFDPDPNDDGTDEYTEMDVHELRFEPPARGYASAHYTADVTEGAARSVEIETRLGSLERVGEGSNAESQVVYISPSRTIAEDFDTETGGRQSILAEALRDIGGQQAKRLKGVDLRVGPEGPEVSAVSTLLFEGARYAPIYAEEPLGSGWRDLLAYEVRSDPISSVETTWDPVDPLAEPGPDAGEPPIVSFEITAVGKYEVSVDASASRDPDGSIQSFAWDWGDGSSESTTATDSHTYEEPGTYTITLSGTDDAGLSDSYQAVVEIDGEPPSASLVVTPASTLTVLGDATGSSDPDGDIEHYHWLWGDGTETRNGSNEELHTYEEAGTYTVEVVLVDARGNTASATQEVTV